MRLCYHLVGSRSLIALMRFKYSTETLPVCMDERSNHYRYKIFLKSTYGILTGKYFQVYLVTLIYRLICCYHSISLHDTILREQLNTTTVQRSYYNK